MDSSLHRLLFTFVVALALPAQAARTVVAQVDESAEREITRSLKDALAASADAAIRRLGTEDGFLRNQQARIALPEGLSRAAAGLRRFGLGRYPAELETTLNRAAESAVPELRVPLSNAISRITFADVRAAVNAGDETAAQYFRRQTYADMAPRFLPAVHSATRHLRTAEAYQQVAGRAAKVGLVSADAAKLDEYIASKALDAVYAAMADEERAMRAYSIRQTRTAVRRVAGAR